MAISVDLRNGKQRQSVTNGEVHNWYRFVLSYPDHLIGEMKDRFGIGPEDTVLDPFCGTGTTLVECKKMGINSIGIEANPACAFASRVKTNWDIDPISLKVSASQVLEEAAPICDELSQSHGPLYGGSVNVDSLKKKLLEDSPEGRFYISSGMIERGWISDIPFYKTLAILQAIKSIEADEDVKNTLKLALASTLVGDISNVHFAPEISVDKRKIDVDAIGAFRRKTCQMALDLEKVRNIPKIGSSRVFQGDARDSAHILNSNDVNSVDYVITSPPYPTEKDYTRQTRLELVLLGYVYDRTSLQKIKHEMIRSHSKGIYKQDEDGKLVADIPEVQAIVNELKEKTANLTYGFAKLYPKIIEEYFGGMYRHLEEINRVLRPGGKCAYVVGEQRTYIQTYCPTGQILGIMASKMGYEVEDILVWRIRKGTTGSGKEIKEEIVILKKPQ